MINKGCLSVFKSILSFAIISLWVLVPTSHSKASLRLEEGSYANRTHIDSALRRANLNFTYRGCDRNPDPRRVQLTPDANCARSTPQDTGTSGSAHGRTSLEGRVTATYEDQRECEDSEQVTRRIHTNHSLRNIYEHFERLGCRPTHLVIQDSDPEFLSQVRQSTQDPTLCSIPETRISKPGFPTDEHSFFNLSANDEGFKIGGHTEYKYNHDTGSWCVRYIPNNTGGCEQPQDWPGPIPMLHCTDTFENSCSQGQGNYHVKGTVSLMPDGQAQIRAMNRTFSSYDAVFEAQKNGELTNTIASAGRIDFQTWRKPNGLVRTIVRSYDQDTPGANHQRAINFFARNVFGIGVTSSWCSDEHCFADVSQERLRPSRCEENPQVNLHNGGSGNLCHSCIGILPGHCAIERQEVDYLRSKLRQNSQFTILDTGEYKMGQNVETGLMANYNRIVTTPQNNRGCFEGHSPSFNHVFDPGEVERSGGTEGRTIQNKKESL